MTVGDLPHILIVDDEDGTAFKLGLDGLAKARVRHPNNVEIEDLRWADLVLMDFIIEDWEERDSLDPIALKPLNGLAVAAVLREQVDAHDVDKQNNDYTAFAIHSGHIGEVSRRLQTTNRSPQVVARLNNLEWAFDKADATRFSREAILATGVSQVSKLWAAVEVGGTKAATEQLLALPLERIWANKATDDVLLCQIPLLDNSLGMNGLLFVRWLLHTILPYPTFLWDVHWTAARLRVSVNSLRTVMANDSTLANDLRALQYNGVFAGFLGDRWWRSAIDQYAWEIRQMGARTFEAFHNVIEERAGVKLCHISANSPSVCVGHDLIPTGALLDVTEVVRIVPDLWPPFADHALVSWETVQDAPWIRSIIHPFERPDFHGGEE